MAKTILESQLNVCLVLLLVWISWFRPRTIYPLGFLCFPSCSGHFDQRLNPCWVQRQLWDDNATRTINVAHWCSLHIYIYLEHRSQFNSKQHRWFPMVDGPLLAGTKTTCRSSGWGGAVWRSILSPTRLGSIQKRNPANSSHFTWNSQLYTGQPMDPPSHHLTLDLFFDRDSFLDADCSFYMFLPTCLPKLQELGISYASYLLEFVSSEMKSTIVFEFVFVGKLRLFRRQCDMQKRCRFVCLDDSKAALADKFTHSSLSHEKKWQWNLKFVQLNTNNIAWICVGHL